MNLMADASSREDIWTKTMDFLNMPDWLKLEMVQSRRLSCAGNRSPSAG